MNKKKVLLILTISVLAIILTAIVIANPQILRNRCVGCEDCIKACPVKAIEIHSGKALIDQEKCIGCQICVKTCTYQAILVPGK